MSSFFVLSYLAFSLPALAAGMAVGRFGIEATALAYGGMLVALCLLAIRKPGSGPGVDSADPRNHGR